MELTQIYTSTEFRLFIDLVLAVFCGTIIGAERELRGKPAGISTHTMVMVGAMLFTFLSSEVDPLSQSRIAAQVVTGIGFLGAGIIMREGKEVIHLTTAASLWVSGAIGMALGFDYHAIALMVTVAVALIPRIPHVSKRKNNS